MKIFGSYFVKNNKKECNIIYEGKIYELSEYFDISNLIKNKNKLVIKLKGINKITDFSYMFYYIKYLLSVPDIHKIKTNNVTNMCGMFCGCSSLNSLPDISNWNIDKVKDISWMLASFPLSSLPDISKWNTSQVTKMNQLFAYCHSLKSLPDISKWDTHNVIDMNQLFSCCS